MPRAASEDLATSFASSVAAPLAPRAVNWVLKSLSTHASTIIWARDSLGAYEKIATPLSFCFACSCLKTPATVNLLKNKAGATFAVSQYPYLSFGILLWQVRHAVPGCLITQLW